MTTTIRCGKATSFGWLRRPELDRHAYVWEAPDGSIVIFPFDNVPQLTVTQFNDGTVKVKYTKKV